MTFPILKGLTYLDSAATSQKPQDVIDTISDYYTTSNANIHRGVYKLSEQATCLYDDARQTVADFIGAAFEEIIFVRNTTEALNMLATVLPAITDRKEIVLTEMEHHANLVPWQQLQGYVLKFIKMKDDYTLDYEDAERKITEKTAIVSFTHISNALGTINNAQKICQLARAKGAISIIDAAQSVPHMPVNVKDLDCDFLAFSGHKMLGPTGIGVLYGRKEWLDKLPPYQFGGDMINTVTYEKSTFAAVPRKFEAGTPNIAGAVGLARAITYLQAYGMDKIQTQEHELLTYALKKLKEINTITIYNPGADKSAGIISFNIAGIHPHDIASILDADNICVRGGHHCCMPLMKKIGISGTTRASFYLYNTKEDVDKLITGLKKAQETFQ